METKVIEMETTIGAPRETVFEFLTTPGKVQLVLPGLVETMNTPEGRMQIGGRFNYRYKMYGVMLEGEWEVLELEEPGKYQARTTGGATSTWKYELEDSNGKTKLSLMVEYEIPQTLFGKVQTDVLASLNQKEIEQYFHNLKTVFELQG